MTFDFVSPLAVVPILVNTGAALLPALIAGVASLAALLFKPRELLRACARHPGRTTALVGGTAALVALIVFWPAPGAAPSAIVRPRAGEGSTTDWTRVALDIIRAEQRAQARTTPTPGASTSTIVVPASALAVLAPDASVPQPINFRGGNTRTGFAGGQAPIGLNPLWEHEEEFAMFLSSPLVHGDRVYGAWCLLDPPYTYGAVVCLDATTGRLIWQLEERDADNPFKGIFSSPALSADGRYLVIGQGLHPDSDCELICIDTTTGRIKWTVLTSLHLESSPAIEGNLVVVGAGAIETGSDHQASSHPGYVFAVDLASGQEVWRHDVADPESSPAIADGIAYIGSGFNGNAVVALRTPSEAELKSQNLPRELWRQPTPHPATGAITVTNDLVLVGCGNGDFVMAAANPAGAVMAFDRLSGELRWQADLPDAVLGPIAVRGNLAICPVRNGEVIALDLAQSGAVLWRQRLNKNAAILGGPAVTASTVYATSQDGYLGVFDLLTGELLEKHYLNAPGKPGSLGMSLSAPYVSQGRVYVGSETGGLRAFDGTGTRP